MQRYTHSCPRCASEEFGITLLETTNVNVQIYCKNCLAAQEIGYFSYSFYREQYEEKQQLVNNLLYLIGRILGVLQIPTGNTYAINCIKDIFREEQVKHPRFQFTDFDHV